MEKQSTGRVMMKLVVSVLALFLLMACGVFFGACKGEHEHNYKKSTSENMAATCGATGYDIYECDGCGDRYAVPTYATGKHNFANGYCTVCGLPNSYDDTQLQQILSDINSKIEAVRTSVNDIHHHDYSKETVTVNATCYASGFVAKKCDCGSSAITDAIDKLDHEWDAETITIPATCVSAGEVYRKCVNCETVVLYQTTSPTGHQYGTEMETIVKASCTEPGYRGYKCSVCGEMGYSESIPATGHRMIWSTKANTDGYAANCKHGDLTWYHCAAGEECSERGLWGEPTEVSAKGGHDFGFGELYEGDGVETGNYQVRRASCTEARVIKQRCRACGLLSDVEVTDEANGATGHSWARKDKDGNVIPFDWSAVKSDDPHVSDYLAPLCTMTGHFTYKCDDCDATYTYIIPIDKYAHTVVMDNGEAKKISTISQLTGDLPSMNGKDEEGKDKNYHWNTVTYTHYLCRECHEWLVKTAEVPTGYKPEDLDFVPQNSDPTNPPAGDDDNTNGGTLTTVDPVGEFTVIEKAIFDYDEIDLDEEMDVWVKAGILEFSWHSWKDYDQEAAQSEPNGGAVTNDYDKSVNIGDANCENDGVHWYQCIDKTCSIKKTHVITPALGHNYDVPDTLAQWEELLSTNLKEEEGEGGSSHTKDETFVDPTSSGQPEETKDLFQVMNARGDVFYGADCTECAVAFLGCTNCFLDGKLVDESSVGEENKNKVVHCMGESDMRRIAITIRDGKLTAIDLNRQLVTETTFEGDTAKKVVLSDEKLAERFADIDAYEDAYNEDKSADQLLNVDQWCHDVTDAGICGEAVEQLYSAFQGGLEKGILTPTEPEGQGNAPKCDEFRKEVVGSGTSATEKYYVFDPLGHVWEMEAEQNTTGKVEEWDVQKTPAEHTEQDWESGLEPETFDCTQPGYTGRWCSRACCAGKEEVENEATHLYDRHQKISLERDLENKENPLHGEAKYAYDLHRQDKDGKEYWLLVKETGKTTEEDAKDNKFEPEVSRGELTYEEINDLFELLVERDHVMDFTVDTENVACGDMANVHRFCVNCNMHFKDRVQELKHLGNYGHYYTIGACGTAFGEDHSIITYDYCLDCGKRVGLEVVDKVDTQNKPVLDENGNVVRVETKNVIWTEGDMNTLTGEPVDILPCELSEITTNYRHFPFDRNMIDALLKETKEVKVESTTGSTTAATTTKTEPAPNYKLYSAVWKAIDAWYETNNDKLLRASCLTGFLMTNSTLEGVEGWTARCYDCYTEFLSHKCTNEADARYPDGDTSKELTHYFVVDNGVITEITGDESAVGEALTEYFVKARIRDGLIADGTISPENLEGVVNSNYTTYRQTILENMIKEANLKDITDYSAVQSDTDKLIQLFLATRVKADLYKATISKCGACGTYNWSKENGKSFTKIEMTTEKAAASAEEKA